jgi:hypothetical protein
MIVKSMGLPSRERLEALIGIIREPIYRGNLQSTADRRDDNKTAGPTIPCVVLVEVRSAAHPQHDGRGAQQ